MHKFIISFMFLCMSLLLLGCNLLDDPFGLNSDPMPNPYRYDNTSSISTPILSPTATTAEAVQTTGYFPYDPALLANANNGKVVLFFHASWCPTCRELDSDIRANMQEITDGLVILNVDYDNSQELKQKYGVTYQHTLVQVDSEGSMINKWSGGLTLKSLNENIS